jgi:predicted phosphodiesterase
MNKPNVALDQYSFLVVSDVHANPEALDRVLRAAPETRYRCCLGDVVGYGNLPRQAVERISGFDVGILGNHDSLLLGRNDPNLFDSKDVEMVQLHKGELSPENLRTLEKFVKTYGRGDILLYHGTPASENEYLLNARDVKRMLTWQQDADLLFGGHTHIPLLFQYDKRTEEVDMLEVTPPFSRFRLDLTNFRYVVSVPSTTPGRLNNPSGGCALFHTNEGEKVLTFFFVEPS